MLKSSHIIALSSYIAIACSGISMGTGCGADAKDHVNPAQVTLEIRFQDDDAGTQPPSSGLIRFASFAAAGPTTHDNVASIQVDITYADSGLPITLNIELNKLGPDDWRADVPNLPPNQQLRFAARAMSASGEIAFAGETLANLTVDNTNIQIPLAPAQNNQTFPLPRMSRIFYSADVFSGRQEPVTFTIQANAGTIIGVQITPLGNPAMPSPSFSPAIGTITLHDTVADFRTTYTPPNVTVDTDFTYQVTITARYEQSAVAIATNFSIHVKPSVSNAVNAQPSVLFNPVILSLTANGSEISGAVELVAAVSDDSAPDRLAFQWSYAPDANTPDATFANNGLGNPGLFQGYTVAHQGTITLAVTDENNGTTILHYPLLPDQFADAIVHGSSDGPKLIVAGNAHTCVLTGKNRVRCWGDNQFGQLGYGNTIDVGDEPTRLPYIAGEVPLPAFDPVKQLVAGNNHTCVLLESGRAYCWGDNRFGQLGYGGVDNLGDNEPVTSFGYVTLGAPAIRIAAGGDHTCAILQSGALRCWGRNDFGQLGHGNTAPIGDNEAVSSAGDVDLGAGVAVQDLALGGFHTCALLTTGTVRCWGRNTEGQLGYGNNQNLGDNEPINNLLDVLMAGPVRKLVAGDLHTCALTTTGLRCWGYGGDGQLGQTLNLGSGSVSWGDQANELPSALPGNIDTGAQVIDVVAGDRHTCALSSDGQLTCWGLGTSGQLGDGGFSNRGTPPATGVDLDGFSAYQITAGAAHTCALRNNGTARCWGAGADGRLGRGNTATSATATGNVDIQILPPSPGCGNGVADPGEQCDDGNTINGDGCDNNCTASQCGNGVIDPGEFCDDGNTADGDGCEANCTIPACGNGVVDPGEQCDDGNAIDGDTCDSNCTIPACGNGVVDSNEQCDDGNSINGDGCDNTCRLTPIVYFKASNTDINDQFGFSVALSADGSTMAVGAYLEDSATTGIGGDQTDNTATDSGAVYVFTRNGTSWSQQAYIKASNTRAGDNFGISLALSADGSTLVVGAPHEDSAATGADGDQTSNSASNSGAVYVFQHSGTTWSQQAYVKASNTGVGDQFGASVALSPDGSTLAVGAPGESSAATGVDGNQANNSLPGSGAVYVFTRSGASWGQQAYVKASNPDVNDFFGSSIALSGDGSTLAVGAPRESSAANVINGNQANNSALNAGAVYVFTRSSGTWSQQAYVKASNTGANDEFGQSVALSADGSTLAVGALGEDSAATGINGDQTSNSATDAGAVYVFTRSGTTWNQQAYVKASNTKASDEFGESIALSADGSALAVGAPFEDSAATGLNGNQTNISATDAGAVYVFRRAGTTWNQQSYAKASNTGAADEFGASVALSSDGATLAVGAFGEDSESTGMGGNQADNVANSSGAAYVFH